MVRFLVLVVAALHLVSAELQNRAYEDELNPDGYTLHSPPHRLVFIGDSYSAGPGLGQASTVNGEDSVRDGKNAGCYRNEAAWPNVLSGIGPHGLPALTSSGNHEQFLACSGDTTDKVLKWQIPEIYSEKGDEPDMVFLSLGGNDAGFAKIIKACIVRPKGSFSDDCDKTLETQRNFLGSQTFRNNMFQVWDEIFKLMPGPNPNDPDDLGYVRFHVYHVLYARFFNDEDGNNWCNTKFMSLWPTDRVYLNIPLRRKLNKYADDLNQAISNLITVYIMKKMPFNGPGEWRMNRLFEVRPEAAGTFQGHRFCEPNVQDPEFNDPSIWFFGMWGVQEDVAGADAPAPATGNSGSVKASTSTGTTLVNGPNDPDPKTCEKDPAYETDEVFSFNCDISVYLDTPGAHQNLTKRELKRLEKRDLLGEDWLKAFHPKSIGHEQYAIEIGRTVLWARPGAKPGECVGITPSYTNDEDKDPYEKRRRARNLPQPDGAAYLRPARLQARQQQVFKISQPASLCMPKATGTAAASGVPAPSVSGGPKDVPPVDPVDLTKPVCEPSPSEGAKVRDAHSDYEQKASYYYCAINGTETDLLASDVHLKVRVIAGTFTSGRQTFVGGRLYNEKTDGEHDDVYDMGIDSVDGCVPEATTGTFVAGYDLAQPVKDKAVTCGKLIDAAWKNCNNKGRGGKITAGCLTYSIRTVF